MQFHFLQVRDGKAHFARGAVSSDPRIDGGLTIARRVLGRGDECFVASGSGRFRQQPGQFW
jgi:hypothetical protein